MSKDLNKLFEDDNKRINDSTQAQLHEKINKKIKNRRLLKTIFLSVIAVVGAAIFSWSLSLVIP